MPENASKILRKQMQAGEQDLLRIVKDARKEVERKIKKASGAKGFSSSASVRNGLYKGIVSEYARLQRKLDTWTGDRVKKVSKDWHTLAVDDFPDDAKPMLFGQFSKKYLDDMVAKVNPSTVDKRVLLNAKLGSMAQNDIDAVRIAVSDSLRKSALTGIAGTELADEMKKAVDKLKPGLKITTSNGRRLNPDSYFAMLNRTVTANVARETYTTTSLEAGYDLQQVEGGITAGSLEPGDPCSRWAGKILSTTGETKGYPTLAQAVADGLFHPNCVHGLSVVTPSNLAESKEQQREEAKEGAKGRAKVQKERKEEGLKPADFGKPVAVKGEKSSLSDDGRPINTTGGVKFIPERQAFSNTVQMEIDAKSLDDGWKKDGDLYIGKSDKGIVNAGAGADGKLLRDANGKAVKKSRKEWFKDWRKQNPNTPVESPWVGVDKDGRVSFLNGRHRTSVLIHDEKRKKIIVSVEKGAVKNAEKLLGGSVL